MQIKNEIKKKYFNSGKDDDDDDRMNDDFWWDNKFIYNVDKIRGLCKLLWWFLLLLL